MLFLAIFGKNVEDAFGPVRYLALYFAGGFVAMLTQTAMTLRCRPRWRRRDRCWWWMTSRGLIGPVRWCWAS